ncbi:hypothetical protein O3Q51_16585 [Cryomorphaceae bacterium 1068]|nr:hypothetical protein [Cryomorphaceae bacterium 1068]
MYGLLFHRKYFVFLPALFLFLSSYVFGQENSENGWVLPTRGSIRVLMVFVEVDHDKDSSVDAYLEGHKNWRVNELPEYKDDIFNVFEGENSLKALTRYYKECSFGELTVLGDYYPEIITVKQSEVGRSKSKILKIVVDRLNSAEKISSENLSFTDFDYWEDESKRGVPKTRSSKFSGVDHLMIFLRNFSAIPNATGQASASSGGRIGGLNTDSYSIFGGGNGMPFKILKHEFNHLLIGGNNFHSGGGNSANFRSYVTALQGGWSMMGAANSALLSPSGWDRYWLGWKPKENDYLISVRDESGQEVNGDIQSENGTRVFVLRDFVTTGDALRIKLPFIPDDEFPQWIWVENHTTYANNGSPTDVFNHEDHDCIKPALPGLYLTRQIDANVKEGKRIYSDVKADYLKPLPATGAYDFFWDDEKLDLGVCVDNSPHNVYTLKSELENPLTGHHELEEPFYYTNSSEEIKRDNMRRLSTRRNRDGSYTRHPHLGHPSYGMRNGEVDYIGLGTNPSTASTITHVNARKGKSNHSQNSDTIYLNGISMRILETRPDLSIKVEVSFNDTLLKEPRRWAGSDILLNNHNQAGTDLCVESVLTLDRGKTITRFVEPDTVAGDVYFSSPTVLRIKSGAKLTIGEEVRLLKDSKIVVEEGGDLELLRNGKVILEGSAEIVFEKGSSFYGKGKIKFKDSSKGSVGDSDSLKDLKSRTCKKKRFELRP